MSKRDWVWLPHASHFICGSKCQFHLATYLGNGYLVSTVGEYWPERSSREIHASIYDPQWHADNNSLKGDYYDAAYMKRFGFEEIGMGRTYETMVFHAVDALEHPDGKCDACPYVIASGDNLDFDGYDNAKMAYLGHMSMCAKWSRKRTPRNPPEIITHKENMKRMRESMESLKKAMEGKNA